MGDKHNFELMDYVEYGRETGDRLDASTDFISRQKGSSLEPTDMSSHMDKGIPEDEYVQSKVKQKYQTDADKENDKHGDKNDDGDVINDSIDSFLKKKAHMKIKERDMQEILMKSKFCYRELPKSCNGYLLMSLMVYISLKYFDAVVEDDPDYYKKVLNTGNSLGDAISHINNSSFNIYQTNTKPLPVDTDEDSSKYKTEEEEETDELEELIQYEENHPHLARMYHFFITALQNLAMIILLIVLPVLFLSNIVLIVFVAAPITLFFFDYLTLRSWPAISYQVLKGVLPAIVCYTISGVILYYLGFFFSHELSSGLCNQNLDNSYQTSILLVFFATMVPTFPSLFAQFVIAVSSNSVMYKSDGVYYRIRLPNSLWLRCRIGFFALLDLAFYCWIFYAGIMYVLAASDPGSLVQAGVAIVFIAEVDKIFFEAYIRSEDREIMDKLFFEYPFFDEDKNIIHEKMNAVRNEMAVLKQRMQMAPPKDAKIMRAKWSLFISSLSSLFTISTFVILNFPVYYILKWRKTIFCADYCWDSVTNNVDDCGSVSAPPGNSDPIPSTQPNNSPSSSPNDSPPPSLPPNNSPPNNSPPGPSPLMFSYFSYPSPTPRNVHEVAKEFAASRHTLDREKFMDDITDEASIFSSKKASGKTVQQGFTPYLPQRNLFMGGWFPRLGN